jgi:hypothetical protein
MNKEDFAVINITVPNKETQIDRPKHAIGMNVKVEVGGKPLLIRNYTIKAGIEDPVLILELPARSFTFTSEEKDNGS